MMRSHVISSAAFGVKVNGINNPLLDAVRTMVRMGTTTRAAGGSARVDLVLQHKKDIDPSFMGNTLPLMEWAKRINEASYLGKYDVIRKHSRAWCAAVASMAKCQEHEDDVWINIKGPASACIATLGRIGWECSINEGWKYWMDREGNKVDLTIIAPSPSRRCFIATLR